MPSSDLVTGYTSGPFRRAVSYEPHRDLIAAVTNAFGTTLISAFNYANDAAGCRISRIDTFDGDLTTNTFGYNIRYEVTSAAMGTNSYGYAYDPIGNRLFSSHNAETNAYTANSLNQYTVISNLCGSVNLCEPFYDADGNMTADERGFHYAWNGENRLVCASNDEVVVTYVYDHHGRMARKETAHKGIVTQRMEYVWDGWNIIQEILVTCNSALVTDNVWGLDLNGTLQGVGGVGGLLAVLQDNGTFFPTCDANGNITEYISANGALAAHYEHSAFGEPVGSRGEQAALFTHQFSTKPYCATIGLSEYQMRTYRAEIGRWLSRDMIVENVKSLGFSVGVNLFAHFEICVYCMCRNDLLCAIDVLGFGEHGQIFNGRIIVDKRCNGISVRGIDMDNATVHVVSAGESTSRKIDVDYIEFDGKWYKISWHTVKIIPDEKSKGCPCKMDIDLREATSAELEDIHKKLGEQK